MSTHLEEEDAFELTVVEEGGATAVTALVNQPAEECFRLFCDANLLAEWLQVVGTVVVHRRDEQGRALEVDFLGSLKRASISYTLVYEYDDAQLEVRWRQKRGSVKTLCGTARFVPEGEDSCRLRYSLVTELPQNHLPWSDELYRARPAETVVLDFCEWLSGRGQKSMT